MKPAPFTYHRPDDIEALVATMGRLGDDAKLLAGGQSLVPLLALRLASPPHIVDLTRVAALQVTTFHEPGRPIEPAGTIEPGASTEPDGATKSGYVSIGANVTQRAVEHNALVAAHVPLLADALPLIAHPQIRNRGTVCGSLAHADPAAELPAVALALDARIVVRSTRGTRTIEAADFFESYLGTALEPEDVVVAVEFPYASARSGAAFREVSRRHGDFAMAGVAASLTLDHNGRIADARLALSGVASVPVRATAAEAALLGATPDDESFVGAAAVACATLDPSDDVHATAAYRTHIAGVLVRRALHAAHQNATRGIDRP